MRLLRFFAIAIVTCAGFATAALGDETGFPRMKGQFIVKLDASTTMGQAEALAQAHGILVKRAMSTPGLFLLALPNPDLPEEPVVTQATLDELRQDPLVRVAMLNYLAEAYQTPDDPLFGTGTAEQWNLFQIGLPGADGAWAVTLGEPDVIVAVLDTDFDASPELPIVVAHEDFFDAAGQIRLLPGWNTFNQNQDVTPPFPVGYFSHGTMVASAIVAGTNNGIGMAGVTWEGVKVLPIRIMNDQGGLEFALIFDGLQFVINWNNDPANTPIVAINMSYGGGGSIRSKTSCSR